MLDVQGGLSHLINGPALASKHRDQLFRLCCPARPHTRLPSPADQFSTLAGTGRTSRRFNALPCDAGSNKDRSRSTCRRWPMALRRARERDGLQRAGQGSAENFLVFHPENRTVDIPPAKNAEVELSSFCVNTRPSPAGCFFAHRPRPRASAVACRAEADQIPRSELAPHGSRSQQQARGRPPVPLQPPNAKFTARVPGF